ncbi:hypothetical protein D9619_010671 [Psilocybe cf. subviscida]|uniref:Uncharacterized protein n=1 Tax=Psilocybe cf. subviscida TaxID=2480587 RepID=A0A8H5BAE4_9AGAR|nr:hypothetical protein D9619_010671 [Psilocybe cf. subviscida]
MSNNSQPTPACLRGLSRISGLAILGNPVFADGVRAGKLLDLDVQIYLGAKRREHLMGVFRYFNATNIDFSEPRVYFIEASFALMPPEHGVVPYDREIIDVDTEETTTVDIVGDLVYAVPLPESVEPDSRYPYVHVSGMAGNPNKTAGTWSVTLEPYITSVIKSEPGTQPLQRPRASFACQHEAKFINTRPTPFHGRYLTMCGYLTDVVFKAEKSNYITSLKMTVDSLEFLGTEPAASSSANGTVIKNTLDSDSPSTRKRGFAKFTSTQKKKGPAASQESEPATPTPAGKKRKVDSAIGGGEASTSSTA